MKEKKNSHKVDEKRLKSLTWIVNEIAFEMIKANPKHINNVITWIYLKMVKRMTKAGTKKNKEKKLIIFIQIKCWNYQDKNERKRKQEQK